MSERNVLAAFISSRKAYDSVIDHVRDGDFGAQGDIILQHIREYYSVDGEASRVDPEILARSVARSLSNDKHKKMFVDIVEDLAGRDVSSANVVRDMVAVKREAAGAKLATALTSGKSPTEVQPLLEEYDSLSKAEHMDEAAAKSVIMNAAHPDELFGTSLTDGLIKVWPKALNDRLDGGLQGGNHLVIFAQPEAGKTLATINMVAGFLYQKLPVAYIGNEEPIREIGARVITRLTGMTKFEVDANRDAAYKLALERGYGNLYMVDATPGSPREIERVITEVGAKVVVIDQLRNINVGEDHFVQKLEKAATEARNIAKRHNVVVVSVTQAGDSASGKSILEMGDVDSSNTGIPAQADVMLGIGGTRDDFARDRRVFSLPKNKRSGRHDPFNVQIIPSLSKIRGVD